MHKFARSIARKSTAAQRLDLLELRDRLGQRIRAFEKKADGFIELDEETIWAGKKGKDQNKDGSDVDSDSDDDSDLGSDLGMVSIHPEQEVLLLPSSLGPGEVSQLHLEKIAEQESALRHGQVNDALDGLRLALSEKSLLLCTEVQNAKSQ